MGRHSYCKHRGRKVLARRRRLMFFIYDTAPVLIGFFIGIVVTSLLVILLEGGL